MSVDQALLEWAASGPARAVFRTYTWERPTLTLGRAEPFPEGWDTRAIEGAGIDVVRRPTGGEAVLHDGELTFAVAVSLPGPWALGARSFANLVADSLADALQGLDLPAVRVGAGEAALPAARPGTSPCFARVTAGEVRVGPHKIAGIASRFTRGAALSHASVPLSPRHRDVALFRLDRSAARAALEEHARSAVEVLGRDVEVEGLGALLARSLSGRLGAALHPAGFPDLGIAEPGRP